MEAIIHARRWEGNHPPKKILVMRFQALGDTVITLPYLQSLKRQYPDCALHLLTRYEVSHIPRHIELFDRIFVLHGFRNAKVQLMLCLLALPRLLLQRYDAVLDLQNHRISRIIRKLLAPKSWVEFDRYSPISAGERTKQTIEALWRWKISLDCNLVDRKPPEDMELLQRNGYKHGYDLVVLNPAGYCSSRNWPLKNYVEFAHKWLAKVNPHTQFILLLMPSHQSKANYLKERLGEFCVDLTGKANQVEAFEVISRASLVLTEDSGLMHMAWVQRIHTLALFSSSRKDWSAPQGEWSFCLDSSDLACGPCDLEVCKFGDNRCLVRYSPDFVLEQSRKLRSVKLEA